LKLGSGLGLVRVDSGYSRIGTDRIGQAKSSQVSRILILINVDSTRGVLTNVVLTKIEISK
jgi:hypothetical protein